ncbi:MAG: hypothetical protein J6V42_03090 [Clostridia bacterium]|nr:hypothetical protein [Clostridia bacterium]
MKKVLALILAVIMLSSVAVTMVSAYGEDVNWEAITNSLGMNIYIGDEMETAPIVNGSVLAGEYSYSRYNEPDEIYNYAGGEIQSGVTEYFAHDADYIYYAAEFVQASDNRAFQWQFKPFNSFDIYRPNDDMTKYYYTRISWQARYKVDEEGFWTDYAGSYQPYINDSCVRVPTAVDETSELYCVAGKDTTTNVKTYEVRLAKSYIAEVNDCEVADVRVIPYFTYFHSAAAVGHIYTEDELLAISDVDYSVFLPVPNELGYRFIVLGEEPDNSTIRVGDSATVSIDVSGEKHYFEFVPEVSGTYRFYSEAIYGYDCDPKVYLLDYNRYGIVSDDDSRGDGQFLLEYYFEAGETYYFEVGCYGSGLGRYRVYLEEVVDDTPEATQIYVGDSFCVDVATSGDSTRFMFVPETSGTYKFYSAAISEYDCDPKVSLLDNNGHEIASDDDGGEAYHQFCLVYDFVAGETYYFDAGCWSSDTGRYYVYLEDDASEAFECPTIYAGETVVVSIDSYGTYQYFRFEPTESGYYSFYSFGDSDTWAGLLDSDFEVLITDDDSGENTNFKITYYFDAYNTYYFQACFLGGNTGSFYATLERDSSMGGGDDIGGGEVSNNNDTHSSTTTTTTTNTVLRPIPSKPSGGNGDKVTLTPKLSMTTLYLVPGSEYTLEVLNGDGVYQWSSSDPCVLIMGLDGDCSFIADGYGTSVITATSLTTGEVLECTVYVVDSAINFEWFERDEENKTLTLELDKYQTRFCFADVIVAFGDIDYVITTDKAGKKPIDPNEAIKLKKGNNVYYVHVTTGDGENVVYKATIVSPGSEASKDDDDDDDDRKSKKKGGCFSSISASALLVLPTLAGGVILAKKRKED